MMPALLLCGLDAGLFDVNCNFLSEPYTAWLYRGQGDGRIVPEFLPLAEMTLHCGAPTLPCQRCAEDGASPPLGEAFYYVAQFRNQDGGVVPACGS